MDTFIQKFKDAILKKNPRAIYSENQNLTSVNGIFSRVLGFPSKLKGDTTATTSEPPHIKQRSHSMMIEPSDRFNNSTHSTSAHTSNNFADHAQPIQRSQSTIFSSIAYGSDPLSAVKFEEGVDSIFSNNNPPSNSSLPPNSLSPPLPPSPPSSPPPTSDLTSLSSNPENPLSVSSTNEDSTQENKPTNGGIGPIVNIVMKAPNKDKKRKSMTFANVGELSIVATGYSLPANPLPAENSPITADIPKSFS